MVIVPDPEFVTNHEATLPFTAKPSSEMSEQASSVAVGGGGDVCVGVGVGGIEVDVSVGAGEGTGVDTDVGARAVVGENPGVSAGEVDVAVDVSVPVGVWVKGSPALMREAASNNESKLAPSTCSPSRAPNPSTVSV